MKQWKEHSTNNTEHSKCKYKYYQNTHTLQNPHIHKPTHYKQVKTNTVQGYVAKGQGDLDNIGQQNLNFFVPQISIDELSSTYYAEFRYVHMFYSSR